MLFFSHLLFVGIETNNLKIIQFNNRPKHPIDPIMSTGGNHRTNIMGIILAPRDTNSFPFLRTINKAHFAFKVYHYMFFRF